ncbi:MAG: hypothetical protein BRD24_00990, partial [Halobacteriales archaeon SW_9_67_24]
GESEFVVALSLDRDWFSPDQASRLVDIAIGEGLVSRDGNDLVAEFDPDTVSVPAGFEPDEELLRTPSAFERSTRSYVRSPTRSRCPATRPGSTYSSS